MSEEITKDLEKIAPKRWKRYPRYKDSGVEWIGEIPEEWKIFKLANMIHKFVDYRGKTPEKTQYGITLVTARNIKNGRITFDNSKEFISESDYHTWMVRGLPKSGDVLITTEAPLGAVAQVSEQNIALAQRIILLKAKDEMLDTFLKYVLMSQTIQYHLYKEATGSTAAGISSERLKQILIPVTNKDEQKCIVDLLDDEISKIDTLISKKQRLIELLKEKRAVIISRAVTKGLDPNAPMKDSGVEWIGEMPKHWRILKTKYVTNLRNIKQVNSDKSERYVGLENVESWTGLLLSTTDPESLSGDCLEFRLGDVLFGKLRPYLAKAWQADFSGFCSGEFIVLEPKKVIGMYLVCLLRNPNFIDFVDSLTYGVKMPRLSPEQFMNLEIPFPDNNEQEKIASFIREETSKLDSFISKIEKSIELLKEYRSALITAAVTGKIDVREEVP